MPVYVGVRYVAEARESTALEQADRIGAAALRLAQDGSPVKLLSTTFVPNEEWVFDVFEALSADEVKHVYAVSGIPVERVTEGVHRAGP